MRGNGVCRRLVRGVFVGMAWSLIPLGLMACGDRAERREEAVDTLTQRQRDSLLSTMPVPGAGAVGKALEAADRARERAEQHDTMRD
jgi:hypothetical protein